MNRDYVIDAVPPALGQRVQEAGSEITVQVNDTGGRGWPRAVIFIPVVRVDDRLQAVIAGTNTPPPYSQEALFKASLWFKQRRDEPPYRFVASKDEWPAAGEYLLTLLLYLQSPGIGDGSVLEIDSFLEGAVPKSFFEQITNAVNKRLTGSFAAALRSGLIVRPGRGSPPLPGGESDPAQRQRNKLPDSIRFALASCQYPSDIFDRMPDNEFAFAGPADASLLALANQLKGSTCKSPPSMVLFVGDQVYVDATAGLFDPKVLDDKYRVPYERQGESRGSQAVLQRFGVEVHMMLDDHEISDNWAPNDPSNWDEPPPIRRGKEGYWKYQRLDRRTANAKLWRDDIVHRELPFFLGDSRTEREPRSAAAWGGSCIMSAKQFAALSAWMVADRHRQLPKFVVSPSALLPRRLAVARDAACALHAEAWDGYPRSLHLLLACACDQEVNGLVFLSGDEHISSVVQARVTNLETGARCTLYSIHSSALYAPYPFANARAEDFAGNETFRFPDREAGPYCCEVKTRFAPSGDGFAVISAQQSGRGWRADVEFHDAHGLKKMEPVTLDLFPPD